MDPKPAELYTRAPPAAAAPVAAAPPARWSGLLLRLVILGFAGGLLTIFVVRWDRWIGAAALQTTDDAYLQSDLTPLAARVAGYVRRVPVGDFQRVKAGDVLIEMVDDDYRATVAQAQANVAAAAAAIDNNRSQRELQQANIQAAEALADATEADLTRYSLESVRQRSLLATGITGTRQSVEQSDANEKRAAATLAQNHAQALAQRLQLGVLDSQLKQLQAALAAQQAALDLAGINLGYTRITAPIDGIVGQRQVRAGQYVGVGSQVIALVPLPLVWVVANFKETQMTRIRVGQRADVTVDAFPDAPLTGHVDSWSPASGSQFSLLPPDNATGNFTKVVQRIPVKIVLDIVDQARGSRDNSSARDLLRPGMSVIARIHTDDPAPP